ncbi:MAG TPA: nitronate monooxygenase [Treponema sp.]|nr:nitronate monooxygenase [Treponema sp.]
MGAGVSDWKLARSVSVQGALGVVSGTALDIILVRRLEQGDVDGNMRRALAAFPDQSVADRIIKTWYRSDGTSETHDFSNVPPRRLDNKPETAKMLDEIAVASNFVEIWLAKEGHDNPVGINYLEKIQLPNAPSIYGAMLAGVDYIFMGAGIPLEVPGIIDAYSRGEGATFQIHIEGAAKDEITQGVFDPRTVIASPPATLKRPFFVSIVSSFILAVTMLTRASGKVDGLIVEHHTAGGHNAPPRGVLQLDNKGEPMYGPKDTVDYAKIIGLNVPFWLGGSFSKKESLSETISQGAQGIQVGTLFAFCRESGLMPTLKRKFLETVRAGTAIVFTHPSASPTGYPFKLGVLDGTLSESEVYKKRTPLCNMGYLRELFKTPEGTIGYRCSAENKKAYVKKGGKLERTDEARCLCNALLANIGLGMKYASSYLEEPLLTVGTHLESLKELIQQVGLDYSSKDVILFLKSKGTVGAKI